MIESGDRVTVHFTTRSLEGSVMETTRNRDPLTFVAGGDEVVRGLSQGVLGLRRGARTALTIPPELGFGNHNRDLVQTVPLSALPSELESGEQLTLTCGDADCDLWVHRVMSSEAQIDANHPLAGETLLVELEIVDVEAA
jgi:FKBP-type peptidyl-prolyl cis-trans isomerase 2